VVFSCVICLTALYKNSQSTRKLQSRGPDGTISRDFLRNKSCNGIFYPTVHVVSIHVDSLGLGTLKAPKGVDQSINTRVDQVLSFRHHTASHT
jgi:hypothetical protein